MTATTITRDAAKELARERLAEVLAGVVPGFRPERPFRCLNPNHEDRHPSARYLSRSKTVKCFSCGWSGDVFDVIGAVHGLTGGDAFKKTYELLGIEAKGGFVRTVKPLTPRHAPGTIEDLLSVIYPPGWDAPEPTVKLPEALTTVAAVETGLAGILAKHPDDVRICWNCGLEGRHFDDAEIGDFYAAIGEGIPVSACGLPFFEWLKTQATPRHMLRKLTRFVMTEWQRRKLEAAFACAFSHLQNETPADDIFRDVLDCAELAMGARYDVPAADAATMREILTVMFERFFAGDDALEIISAFRRREGLPHARN